MSAGDLWRFLPLGYVLTVLVEAPVLFVGLSRRHSPRRRLAAGLWLTACTYPIVVLVLPLAMRDASRGLYLLAAETLAPLAECALFFAAFWTTPADSEPAQTWSAAAMARDAAAIVVANAASFLFGLAVF